MHIFQETVFTPVLQPAENPLFRYRGFHPGAVTMLPKGHVKEPGLQPFPVDVTWQRDMAICMRDGAKIYADIFRPTEGGKVPAIIPWSPYGKVDTCFSTYGNMGPFQMGIPSNRLSGYETFEGPNPAEWAARGYAVVDVDARGCGHSEGDIAFWGQQEAEDIYDTITWIAEQPWCNGAVVMAGNSWLSISQTNFASRFFHPALKAIAPWEGLSNPYTQQACRGGIPCHPFLKMVLGTFAGFGKAENLSSMLQDHPLYDSYWESKAINLENVQGDLPVYFVASYSSKLHSEGSFEGFRAASTSRKWIRVHSTQEWHDLYSVDATNDLQRFFDHYAKGIPNGWEDTPKVRLSLLGFDGSPAKTIVERPEEQWPPARVRLEKYYLDAATNSLTTTRPSEVATVSHEGHSLTDSSSFTLFFPEYTELSGRPFVKIFISCPEHNDLDVFVQIQKISVDGNPLVSLNWLPMPCPESEVPDVNITKHLGPQGMIRASHRSSLQPRAHENELPVYLHNKQEMVQPGKIIDLMIPIWPIGMSFAKGEGLLLKVSGHDMSLPEVAEMRLVEPIDDNKGRHVIHTGGDYDSYLVLPRLT